MRTVITAIGLIVGIGLGGCATTETSLTEKGMKSLTEAELKAIHSRTRMGKWTNDKNNSGTIEYRPDGSASVNWGTGSANGRYRISGDTLCSKFEGVRGGQETCFRVYQTGDNQFKQYYTNGNFNAEVSYMN